MEHQHLLRAQDFPHQRRDLGIVDRLGARGIVELGEGGRAPHQREAVAIEGEAIRHRPRIRYRDPMRMEFHRVLVVSIEIDEAWLGIGVDEPHRHVELNAIPGGHGIGHGLSPSLADPFYPAGRARSSRPGNGPGPGDVRDWWAEFIEARRTRFYLCNGKAWRRRPERLIVV